MVHSSSEEWLRHDTFSHLGAGGVPDELPCQFGEACGVKFVEGDISEEVGHRRRHQGTDYDDRPNGSWTTPSPRSFDSLYFVKGIGIVGAVFIGARSCGGDGAHELDFRDNFETQSGGHEGGVNGSSNRQELGFWFGQS